MTQSLLTQRIHDAAASGRKALIPFLPGGFPDKERFWKELKALDDNGADIIEIGVPFSDPVADGPVVEQASLDCLEAGVTLAWIIGELKQRKGEFKSALVLMGYLNPFLQYGFEKLAKDAAEAGVSGFIIPDLPYEESEDFKAALKPHGLDLVPLIGLNTPAERMALYAAESRGFVYVVSVLGTTGARDSLPQEVAAKLDEARQAFDLPLALGFGIKTPEQLATFGDRIDAAVFGSSLITYIREGGDSAGFMARWK